MTGSTVLYPWPDVFAVRGFRQAVKTTKAPGCRRCAPAPCALSGWIIACGPHFSWACVSRWE